MAMGMMSGDANMSKNIPQASAFAPSREDVLSTLGFFFGDPAVPEKLKDYSEHHAMTYHFPDGECLHTCQPHCHSACIMFQTDRSLPLCLLAAFYGQNT